MALQDYESSVHGTVISEAKALCTEVLKGQMAEFVSSIWLLHAVGQNY